MKYMKTFQKMLEINEYGEDKIDKSFFSHLGTDLNRRNVWEYHLFPKGNENFANEHAIAIHWHLGLQL